MQKLIFSLVFLATILFSGPELLAQNNKKVVEAEFLVNGVCNMCKNRIETAAYDLHGVKSVEWNKTTKKIVVKFKPSKVSLEDIHAAIAAVGHTTSEIKATEEDYESLPNCCHYEEVDTH